MGEEKQRARKGEELVELEFVRVDGGMCRRPVMKVEIVIALTCMR